MIGNSMGGMQTWIWAQKYPDFMEIAVPMASLPTEMAGRNWMMRRLIVDSTRQAGGTVTWQGARGSLATALAQDVRGGDVVLTIGAGDITKTGPELLRALGESA